MGARGREHPARGPAPARVDGADRPASRSRTRRYNEAELIELGFAPTAVAPILVDFSDYDGAPDRGAPRPAHARRARTGGADWLFVGRLAPNKCQHDVIAAFAVVPGGLRPRRPAHARRRQERDPLQRRAQAHVPASSASRTRSRSPTSSATPSCSPATGPPTSSCACPSTRASASRCSRRCTSTSRSSRTRAAAVPETVGDGGLLLDDKDPLHVAAAVVGGARRLDRAQAAHGRRAANGSSTSVSTAPVRACSTRSTTMMAEAS